LAGDSSWPASWHFEQLPSPSSFEWALASGPGAIGTCALRPPCQADPSSTATQANTKRTFAGRQNAITRGHRNTYMVSGDDWRAGAGRNA